MRITKAWLGAAVVGLGLAAAAPAARAGVKDDIEELKKGQQQILQQIQELKQLIQAQARPAAPAGPNVAGVVFDLGAHTVKGSSAAKLTLVEFTDYQ